MEIITPLKSDMKKFELSVVEIVKERRAGKLHIVRFIEDSGYQFCTIGSFREQKLNSARELSESPFVAKMFFEGIKRKPFSSVHYFAILLI